MKWFLIPAAAVLGLSACSTSNRLPPLSSVQPEVVEEGTLANQALIRDATASLHKINGGKKPIAKFVIQQPVGPVGKKAWRELWVYDPEGAKRNFIMTFEEDGTGSAEYEIGTM